ncbi:MAG: 50S ribosomal protein L16 [Planctomycetota bacterium]|jgi:large subunit ribosomal protein L16|nr:50S ribosomal protein L16 [Planctomycetota bacterium]MDP7130600.1 50S ribosomal protein L16 [Planctomycetota bacterium]
MPLMPKRVKWRKVQRGSVKGNACRGNRVSFGSFGLQALEPGWITARQIEAGRIAASHYLGSEGKLWIRVFPDKPVSARPAESRMGSGKGEPEKWIAVVRPGTVMFELGGVPEDIARNTLNRMAHKMPIRTRMVLAGG